MKLFDCIVLGAMVLVVFAFGVLTGWAEVAIGAWGLFALVAIMFAYLHGVEDGDTRGIFPLPQFWKADIYEASYQTRKTKRRR